MGSWFNPLQQDSILCDKLVHIILLDVSHEIEKFGFWDLKFQFENFGKHWMQI